MITRDKWNTKWDKAYPWAEKDNCVLSVASVVMQIGVIPWGHVGRQAGRDLRLLSMRQLENIYWPLQLTTLDSAKKQFHR